MKWITSDLHFNHNYILKYQPNRNFKDINEMNEAIISEWNRKVKEGDTIYHIGDFAFNKDKDISSIASRLNGNKVFIIGNHDDEGRLQDMEKQACILKLNMRKP